MTPSRNSQPSDDSLLAHRRPGRQPLPAETRQVDGLVPPGQEQFCHRAAASGRMHEAMPGKACQQVEVGECAGAGTDDDVPVEVILVVEAGQGAPAAGPLELREPMG